MTFDQENETDPLRNGFSALKIFNEEIIPPGKGFVLHMHKDMIIVTYVHEGMIIYNNPMENPGLLKTGEFHHINNTADMKQHSFDASPYDDAHVFQSGFTPGAGVSGTGEWKKLFPLTERKGVLRLIASPDGKNASLKIQQDVHMYSTFIHKGNHMVHELSPGRSAWLHVVKGRIVINELHLQEGDGAGFSNEISVSFTAMEPTEILLFNLASPGAP
jgi:redox-sensitive bicupin YhaK (pirin superfamily)